MTIASEAPTKSRDIFIAKRVVAFLREIGCKQGVIVVTSDQEPAIISVVTEVGRVRAAAGGGRFIVEAGPVGSSASNGIKERAIRSVQQQVRVTRSAVEERTGAKLTLRHPIMTWMVECATYLLNRYEVGHDGKTAYERCKGKVAKVLGSLVEATSSGRCAGEDDVLVGRRRVHQNGRCFWPSPCGGRERCL